MSLARCISGIAAVLLGLVLAAVLFGNFEIFEVKSVAMMPILEPGQRVAVKKCGASEVDIGDLVLYEADAYDFDSQEGRKSIRIVSGKKDGKLKLSCSPEAVYGKALTIDEDKILGKVILWERKSEN